MIYPNEISHFPEELPEGQLPQLLGIFHGGVFHRLKIMTFHLWTHTGGGVRIIEHRHNVFHAVLYINGRGHFMCNGQKTAFRPGTLALTPPGMPHCFAPFAPAHALYHEVTFSLDAADDKLIIPYEELFRLYFGGKPAARETPLHLTGYEQAELERNYRELETGLMNFSFRPDLAYQKLFALLQSIHLHSFADGEAQSAPPDGLQKAKLFIQQNFNKNLRLREIARQAAMSQEHFCREFKKRYNETPISYRQSLRADAARKLLLCSDRTLQEIADQLGFTDEYYFSKTFKKIAGESPGRFRARERGPLLSPAPLA